MTTVFSDVRKTDLGEGSFLLEYITSDGDGTMRNIRLAEGLYASLVDFALAACPPYGGMGMDYANCITINYCVEGRCEVDVPGDRTVIVSPGDCCVCCATQDVAPPEIYRYPLRRYRGLEFFIFPILFRQPAFSLLQEAGITADTWPMHMRRRPAVIFSRDEEINALLEACMTSVGDGNTALCQLKLMELLILFERRGIPDEGRVTYLTRAQLAMAQRVYDRLTAAPDAEYSLRALAGENGIGVTTLNNCFRAVYGAYIPTFMREYRMRMAAHLLATSGEPVYEVAARVGYANASKFSAAFSRFSGMLPLEYRQRHAARNPAKNDSLGLDRLRSE